MNRYAVIIALLLTLPLTGCGAVMDIMGKQSLPGSNTGRPTASLPSSQGEPEAVMGPYGAKTAPYTVRGVRYYPMKSAHGYSENGVASWYGSENHGMQTASGSIYNMYAMSAAHKTLPLGTVVRVTNLENRQSLDVLVNDRGPFISGRLIDLSYGAARRLGFADQGLTRVNVTAVGTSGALVAEAPRTTTTAPASTTKTASATASKTSTPTTMARAGAYYVQVGAFSLRANAEQVHSDLRRSGVSGAAMETRLRSSGTLYVVKAGPYATKDKAARALDELRRYYPSSFIASI
ncbi:MAG: septal ring lytic transglycosylase RlpA family protein [Desulfovibrionaceae bacterium]